MGCIYFETVLTDFCLQKSDWKYFPFLSKALWSKINSCYNLKSETKKNTTLLLVELLAITGSHV